jgi:S1-C subfamily serine protease
MSIEAANAVAFREPTLTKSGGIRVIKALGMAFAFATFGAALAQTNTAQSVYTKVESSILVVETKDASGSPLSLGSAVSIAPNRAVTNCHVLDGSVSSTVRQGLRLAESRIVAQDKSVDLCVLAFDVPFPTAILGSGLAAMVGQSVYAIGSPAGLEKTLSEGIVSSMRSVGSRKFIQTSAPLSGGSSGGGLFDEKGSLIAITTLSVSGGQNLNFAIPVEYIPTAAAQISDLPNVSQRRRNYATQSREPNWKKSNDLSEMMRTSTFKTDPSTWSSEGGFGLKWGMGPGDVVARVPELKVVVRAKSDDTQVGSVQLDVQDRPATVFFHFLKGRLYRVEISGFVMDRPSLLDYDATMKNRSEGWKWRERLRLTLQNSYGKPMCEPSEYSRQMFCDQSDRTCPNGRPEKIEKVLRWVWRTSETQVEVAGTSPYGVSYSDLLMNGPIANFEQQSAQLLESEKARARDADAARLGGQSASGESAPTLAEAKINFDISVPELQCFQVPEPSADKRRSPSSWSAIGLGEFKWGMAVGDVKERLTNSSESTWRPGTRYTSDSLFVPQALRLFGNLAHASFYFQNGQLASITVNLDCDIDSARDCPNKTDSLFNSLDKTYGGRRCIAYDEGLLQCKWDAPSRVWASALRSEYGLSNLEFKNPNQMPQRVQLNKSKSTSSSGVWSKDGWNKFRWGMNFGDIEKIIMDPAGDFRAKKDMACYRDNAGDRWTSPASVDINQLPV